MPVVLEEAWGRLVAEKYVDNTRLRSEIALSWERCLVRQIDPVNLGRAGIIQDFREQDEQARRLLAVALPHVQQLYDAVKGGGYILLLTDANGIILHTQGDRKIARAAETLSLIPGASCSEEVIGTNSPGTCLVARQPIQIVSHEHYCRNYHDWSCSSAPILDGRGNLLGTLDLSNIDRNPHPLLLLDLINMTAKTIGMDWDFHLLREDVQEKYHYFNTAIDGLGESLIFLDEQDNISHINKNALKLLGGSARNYLGQSLQVIVPRQENLARALAEGRRFANVRCNTPRGPTAVSLRIDPLKDIRLRRIGAICCLKEKDQCLAGGNATRYAFEDFIGESDTTRQLLQQAQKVARTDASVLIQGESGTGKEILAQAIHGESDRRHRPFVAVNCAALPLELIQSELFGYEEGAFTGARRGGKVGKFELAHGGTLFLDEIGDMPPAAQANLLRALQERSILRLGGAAPVPVDVRVIAATNKDLPREIAQSRFRADLYYRVAAVRLLVPPLRERGQDLWRIIDHLVRRYQAADAPAEAPRFTHQVRAILETHDWPGNVRELENVVLYFLNKTQTGQVTVYDLPVEMHPAGEAVAVAELRQVEQEAIQATLAQCGHNISASAKALGISRATLYRKMRRFSRPTD